ncbi:DUF1090 domain-containing protein [Entomomonas asaccharolytica]|nr:DUF1090 domain-containing protein [Entomomonas asaccharolytica]
MFKNLVKIALVGSVCAMPSLVYADTTTGCSLKAEKIQEQISYAKAHGNSHRVAGLETALSEVKAHCTEASLRKDLEQDIAEKQQKVVERQTELTEAQAKGDAKKIAKKQSKLAEAKQELAKAEQELKGYFK